MSYATPVTKPSIRFARSARQLAYIGLVLLCALYAPVLETILAAILAFLITAMETRAPLRAIGLSAPARRGRTILTGVLVGIALLLFSKLLLTPLIEAATGAERDLTRLDFVRGDLVAYLSFLPLLWLSAALCEEVVYRGFLITRLLEAFGSTTWLSKAAAVTISSVAFALVHAYQGPAGLVLTGVMGVLLSVLFVVSRFNLWCNVIVHGVYDTLSLGLIWLSWDHTLARWGRLLIS
ncbi:MAG TPA: CPBP family intramembrane glutamic endopeptidase [Steroidobacteraceae bacterium]|jgi:membrane protease YdiL (CAAX protease family)